MKRIICLSMCGALLLMMGSCKNEFEPSQVATGGNAIGFSVHRSKQADTRVALNDLTALQASGFRLWGYVADFSVNTTYSYIANLGDAVDPNPGGSPGRSVTYDSSLGWVYGTPSDGNTQAQWPVTASNFIAYAGVAPADLATPPTAGDATTIKTLTYAVPDGSDQSKPQKDLLVASNGPLNKGDFATKVPLNFTHALSGIAVKAKTAAADQKVTIHSIHLMNLLTQGDLDMMARTWSNQSVKATGEMPLYTTGMSLPEDGTAADVVAATDLYLVLPQTATTVGTTVLDVQGTELTDAAAEANIYMVVRWEYKEADDKTEQRTSLCAVVSSGISPIVLAPNTRYTFNLTFDAYSRQIVFNPPTVEAWDTTPTAETVGPDKNVGVIVGTVGWAKTDLAAPGVFAATDLSNGYYYQWNRNVGWNRDATPFTGYSADGTTSTSYPSSGASSGAWATPPCPDGWRLPVKADFDALWNASSTRTVINTNGKYAIEFAMNNNAGIIRFSMGGYLGQNGAVNAGYGSRGSGYYMTNSSSNLYSIDVSTANAVSVRWTTISNTYEGELIRCVKDMKQP